MKVYNQTKIDNTIMFNIMRKAEVTSQGPIKAVIVRYNKELTKTGLCSRRGAVVVIELRDEYSIPTLAHEIRHLAQHTVGLTDVMTYERENVVYNQRAHEIDANEFSKLYK
jgi:Zn-dependent peptidase ImmA (M78 family)